MIEIPLDSTPSKEFSVNTPIGVLRFRTQWDAFMGQWYMDIISPNGVTWMNRVALTSGVDNLLAGSGIPELRYCSLFAIDTKDFGVNSSTTITAATDIYYLTNTGRFDSNGGILWGNNASYWSKGCHVDDTANVVFGCDGLHLSKVRPDGSLLKRVYIGFMTAGYDANDVCVSGDYVLVGGRPTTDTLGNYGNFRKYTKELEQVSCGLLSKPSNIGAITTDSNGNIYAVGTVNANLGKYNSSGVLQWYYDHGAELYDVCVDGSGNVYVTGERGTGNYTTRKLNSSGSVVWSIDHTSATNRIAIDSSSNVYVVGYASSVGLYKFRKYNSSGSLQWSKTTGGSGVAVDANGYIWVCGTDPLEAGVDTLWKYDSSGTALLQCARGSVYSISPYSTGGVFFSGSYTRTPKQITIGAMTYSFTYPLYAPYYLLPYEVMVEDTNAATMDNFANAINGAGTGFGAGTLPHPDVTAVACHPAGAPSYVLIRARTTGKAGDSIALRQNEDPGSAFQMIKFGYTSLEHGTDHGGNHKLDLYNDIGTTYRVFMTFPDDTVLNPFTTTF